MSTPFSHDPDTMTVRSLNSVHPQILNGPCGWASVPPSCSMSVVPLAQESGEKHGHIRSKSQQAFFLTPKIRNQNSVTEGQLENSHCGNSTTPFQITHGSKMKSKGRTGSTFRQNQNHNITKLLGCSKSRSMRKIYSNKYLYQEKGSQINSLTLHHKK